MSLILLLTFVTGLLNLCLGYALAVRMGYGPQAALNSEMQPCRGGMLGLSREEPAAPGGPSGADRLVLELRQGVLNAEDRLTRFDLGLRSSATDQVLPPFAQARQLQELCDAYLTELGQGSERFRVRLDELGPLREQGERIDVALVEQITQVSATLQSLAQIDSAEPVRAAAQLLEETRVLARSLHRLRDLLETTYVAFLNFEEGWNNLDEHFCTDSSMSIPNRIGLERILREWWQQGRSRTRAHSMAMFDLDGMAEINQVHGIAAGNQVLRAVAERMGSQLGPDDLIVRYSGHRILLLLSDVEGQAAASAAERIARSIREAEFHYGEAAISVRVSAGAIEIAPSDAPQSLLERLEQMLVEAERLDGDTAPAPGIVGHAGLAMEELEALESPLAATR